MTFVSLSRRTVARLAVVMLVAAGTMLTSEQSFAASSRGPDFRFGNGDSQLHFNIDPDPCGVDEQHLRNRKLGCPAPPPRLLRRGGNAPRGPGSSAFGLQFDNDGY
jgi:hypothetical protein